MKRKFTYLISLSILLLACNISTTGITPVATETSVNPATEEVVEPTVLPTETPAGPQANVSCSELSLYLDPALASGYNCETIPESPDGMEIHPQYTKLTLTGYVLSAKFFEPHISVIPLQRYDELIPDLIPGLISQIQTLTSGGSTSDPLPFLPTFNAAQVFHAQYQANPFLSGEGIRFLTEYAQYFAPVNNTDLFYTYQGLSSDGKYWVSAILPINNSILPADAINPPGGMSWEDFSNNYNPYINDMINQLNSQSPDSYSPSLSVLDALVSSILIQP